MEWENNSINLGDYEKKVLEEQLERGVSDELPSFSVQATAEERGGQMTQQSALRLETLERTINIMGNTKDNFAFRNLYSCRKILGPAILFGKRIVRKLLKWYIEPVCNQQTEFNCATTSAVQDLHDALDEMNRVILNCESVQNEKLRQQEDSYCRRVHEQTEILKNELQIQEDSHVAQLQEQKEHIESKLVQFQEQKVCMESKLIQLQEQTERIESKLIQFQEQKVYMESKLIQLQEQKVYMESKLIQLQEQLNAQMRSWETLEGRLQQTTEHLVDKMQNLEDQQRPKYTFGHIESASQSGEDTIVAFILDRLKIPFYTCTYLDLGANHFKRMSNTYLLYQYGARGVLVEANPNFIPELISERPGDVVLNRCVSDKSGEEKSFYILNGDGLSSMDFSYISHCIEENPVLQIEKIVKIETITLHDLLKDYLPMPPTLVSIDVEGMELKLLQDLDLEYYRPLLIIVENETEDVGYTPKFKPEKRSQKLIDYMESVDYIEYAFTGINFIFLDRRYMLKRFPDEWRGRKE